MSEETIKEPIALVHQGRSSKVWHAWDREARLIGTTFAYKPLSEHLENLGYREVSPNSYEAKCIRDKFRARGYRV